MLYFLIVLLATTIGALTGMGGGVIIKPVLDILGDFNASNISVLSCVTVFTMALVSVTRILLSKERHVNINPRFSVSLSIGSIAGGNLGHLLFSYLTQSVTQNRYITITQNIILGLMILLVFIYMIIQKRRVLSSSVDSVSHTHDYEHEPKGKASHSNEVPLSKATVSFMLKNTLPPLLAGILLGAISSFLGIGGGPLNVAFLIFLFALDTKTAAVYSLISILFSQSSNLIIITFTEGFSNYNLDMLPFMLVGAVTGGLLGAALNKKLPERHVDTCFMSAQILVIIICIFNIISQ